jgi:hypothetical protein
MNDLHSRTRPSGFLYRIYAVGHDFLVHTCATAVEIFTRKVSKRTIGPWKELYIVAGQWSILPEVR